MKMTKIFHHKHKFSCSCSFWYFDSGRSNERAKLRPLQDLLLGKYTELCNTDAYIVL